MIHENQYVGDGNIWAAVVAHSVNPWGDEVITYRLHYPRFIHAEFMTHRMFSRNASSSRAIPVMKMIEQVAYDPAMPIHWGLNQAGMQANGQITKPEKGKIEWRNAATQAVYFARKLYDMKLHKQVVNRLLEPFQFMNVVMSATDIENFFWLRIHEDADPNIKELATVMEAARDASTPEELKFGEWHTPYVDHFRDYHGNLLYMSEGQYVDVEEAKKISSSCAAQASYRNLDTTLVKAVSIYDRLIGSERLHSSPFEHVATPFSENEYMLRMKAKRILDSADLDNSDQILYKGNFKGWTQLRKLFPNENVK